MAFDLNKNDGSTPDSSNKTSTSTKFDLSKGEADGAIVNNPPKSKTGMIGLVAILIIGGGIWYYSSHITPENTAGNSAITEANPSDSSGVVKQDAQQETQSDVAVTDTTAASANTQGSPAPGSLANSGSSVQHSVVEKPVDGSAPVVSAQAGSEISNAAVANLNHKIPATFGQGSSSFTRIDRSLVKRIVYYLAENPEASIFVNGYASSDGLLAINQTVSQARADAFKKYLISKNVEESRVVALGKGIEDPIASNATDAGRKKNRRVEIILP